MANFYCQKKCGDENFSIDEWNKAYKMCDEMGLSEKETSYILEGGEPCKVQCEACINIVLETQRKRSDLVRKFMKQEMESTK